MPSSFSSSLPFHNFSPSSSAVPGVGARGGRRKTKESRFWRQRREGTGKDVFKFPVKKANHLKRLISSCAFFELLKSVSAAFPTCVNHRQAHLIQPFFGSRGNRRHLSLRPSGGEAAGSQRREGIDMRARDTGKEREAAFSQLFSYSSSYQSLAHKKPLFLGQNPGRI